MHVMYIKTNFRCLKCAHVSQCNRNQNVLGREKDKGEGKRRKQKPTAKYTILESSNPRTE